MLCCDGQTLYSGKIGKLLFQNTIKNKNIVQNSLLCPIQNSYIVTKVVIVPFQLASVEREKQRWEKEKSQLKASIEENKERMLKLESYWIEAQTLCHTVNEHLKEAQAQYQALEKKYNKAKKLIKDFQQK